MRAQLALGCDGGWAWGWVRAAARLRCPQYAQRWIRDKIYKCTASSATNNRLSLPSVRPFVCGDSLTLLVRVGPRHVARAVPVVHVHVWSGRPVVPSVSYCYWCTWWGCLTLIDDDV